MGSVCAKIGSIWEKWLYWGKIGVMGKTVVLEQSGLYLARIGFIWPNRLYLAKRVFFDQNLFYLVAIVGVSKSF